MRRIGAALRGIWEFVVGDDPLSALGVVVSLGLTAVLAGAGLGGWWLMPVAVSGLLAVSVIRTAR